MRLRPKVLRPAKISRLSLAIPWSLALESFLVSSEAIRTAVELPSAISERVAMHLGAQRRCIYGLVYAAGCFHSNSFVSIDGGFYEIGVCHSVCCRRAIC